MTLFHEETIFQANRDDFSTSFLRINFRVITKFIRFVTREVMIKTARLGKGIELLREGHHG